LTTIHLPGWILPSKRHRKRAACHTDFFPTYPPAGIFPLQLSLKFPSEPLYQLDQGPAAFALFEVGIDSPPGFGDFRRSKHIEMEYMLAIVLHATVLEAFAGWR